MDAFCREIRLRRGFSELTLTLDYVGGLFYIDESYPAPTCKLT